MPNQHDLLIQFLKLHPTIDMEKAVHIAQSFNYAELKKGELMLEAGKSDNYYWILTDGAIRSWASTPDGTEVTTGFYFAVKPVFEVYSFFNQTISTENYQALTPCKGFQISFEKLNLLFHQMPEFREFGRGILVKSFAQLKSRMLHTITKTAEERYLQLITTQPEIFKFASLKQIASYLGITDTSLSRIRKEITKK